MGAIVVDRIYFTCTSWKSNPGRWIYMQTLYHVAVKASLYRKAVEVYFILSPMTFSPTKLDFVPEVPSHRESFLMRLGELLPGPRVVFFIVGAIVVDRIYFTCTSWESNPGRWIYMQTLHHVAVKPASTVRQ